MKVTRIAGSKNLNRGKYQTLREQAQRLGAIRSEVWQRYGSINGINLTDRKICDTWLKEQRIFPVLTNAWKETLRDAKANIDMSMAAAKVRVKRAIRRHTENELARKELYTKLQRNQFKDDRYLARVMRKYWPRGHNHVYNQIIVRADDYTPFELGSRIAVQSCVLLLIILVMNRNDNGYSSIILAIRNGIVVLGKLKHELMILCINLFMQLLMKQRSLRWKI
jgi:hypothetical protein